MQILCHWRQRGQPRGGHVYHDFREDFGGGKVTIVGTSFLRYQHPRIKPYPPRGHFTFQIQEQQLPPLVKALNKGQPLNPDLK